MLPAGILPGRTKTHMIRIAVLGVLGAETALRLLEEHKKVLENRFSGYFIRRCKGLGAKAVREQEIMPSGGKIPDGFYFTPIGEGGLFGALWKACEELQQDMYSWTGKSIGCEVDLETVPVAQEVTEICELYREDPLETSSEGAWLLIWEEEKEDALKDSGLCIPEQSAIIGKLTQKKRRVVFLGDRTRFLTPTERQKLDMQNTKNEV